MIKNELTRLEQAFAYLKRHGIDIYSRADKDYRNAIFIAAGCELDEIHDIITKHKELD